MISSEGRTVKRAAIYARVSTDEQASYGYSLDTQVENCIRFGQAHGFTLVEVFQDDISGAMAITYRPEGGRLQSAIEHKEINTVVVYQVDRLSRDLIDLLITVRDWLRRGVEIWTVDMGQVKSENDIALIVKGWQSTDERAKIAERTNRGRWAKARAGKAVGSGGPPFGYDYHDGELTINEAQAATVRIIYQWYVHGDENGRRLGMVEIANRLTDEGVPTPSQAKGEKRRKIYPQGVWDTSSVGRILTSDVYCGILRYGKNIGNRGRGGQRPESEHVIVNIPAIVDRDTWEAAQEQRVLNNRRAKRKSKRVYLMSGRIRCGRCGYMMVGTAGHYQCPRRYWKREGAPCQEPRIKASVIDYEGWQFVLRLVKDPEYFEAKLRMAQAEELAAIQPKTERLEHFKALIAQVETEADELAQALLHAKGLVLEKLLRQQDEIDARYKALASKASALEEELSHRALTDETISDLRRFRELAELGLSNPTNDDMRHWLQILNVEATVTNGRIKLSCSIPAVSYNVDMNANFKKFEDVSGVSNVQIDIETIKKAGPQL